MTKKILISFLMIIISFSELNFLRADGTLSLLKKKANFERVLKNASYFNFVAKQKAAQEIFNIEQKLKLPSSKREFFFLKSAYMAIPVFVWQLIILLLIALLGQLTFSLQKTFSLVFMLIVSVYCFYQARNYSMPKAIVFAEKVDLLSGPSADYPTLGTLSQGLTVSVEGYKDGFVKINHSLGTGWIEKNQIEEI